MAQVTTEELKRFWDAMNRGDCQTMAEMHALGFDINQEIDGARPLMWALMETNFFFKKEGDKVVLFLIMRGADLNFQDKSGNTPLHKAAGKGLTKACQLMLERGARSDIVNHIGNVPLHEAADFGCPETVELLVNANKKMVHAHNRSGETPLMVCANMTSHKRVKNVTPTDSFGEDYVKIAQILFENGALVNEQNKGGEIFDGKSTRTGQTALMKCAQRGKIEMLKYLLSLPQVDLFLKDGNGKTAFDYGKNNDDPSFERFFETSRFITYFYEKKPENDLFVSVWQNKYADFVKRCSNKPKKEAYLAEIEPAVSVATAILDRGTLPEKIANKYSRFQTLPLEAYAEEAKPAVKVIDLMIEKRMIEDLLLYSGLSNSDLQVLSKSATALKNVRREDGQDYLISWRATLQKQKEAQNKAHPFKAWINRALGR